MENYTGMQTGARAYEAETPLQPTMTSDTLSRLDDIRVTLERAGAALHKLEGRVFGSQPHPTLPGPQKPELVRAGQAAEIEGSLARILATAQDVEAVSQRLTDRI